MNLGNRLGLGAVLALLTLASGSAPAAAQTSAAPPAAPAPTAGEPRQPFAPDWGMLAGWDVFAKKGCGKCHSVRGAGGGVGPDLARIQRDSFFDLGAGMWNHLPAMGARMRAARVERPQLSAREVSDLLAFLFTAQYFDEQGDARAGERLFGAKGCVQCHAVGGRGGAVGPGLDKLKRVNSPVMVAAAMWNHGPRMAAVMQEKGIPRPAFQAREMTDLIAFLLATARDAAATDTTQVVPGTPERGEKIFAERRCAGCHAVNGRGGTTGPDLGRKRQHVSLTRFAGTMWNHGPAMWAKMKELGQEPAALTGQDMADILAYLYTAHYFERGGSASRGQQLAQDKGCLGCHSVRGQGGRLAADFASSAATGSPGGVVAAMWNHGVDMEQKAQQREIAWPRLTGQELGDIVAYLRSLGIRPPAKPKK